MNKTLTQFISACHKMTSDCDADIFDELKP